MTSKTTALRNNIARIRKYLGLPSKKDTFKGMEEAGLRVIEKRLRRLEDDLKRDPGSFKGLQDQDLSDRYGLTIVDADAVLQRLKGGWRP